MADKTDNKVKERSVATSYDDGVVDLDILRYTQGLSSE
jgi:hypothetical protein